VCRWRGVALETYEKRRRKFKQACCNGKGREREDAAAAARRPARRKAYTIRRFELLDGGSEKQPAAGVRACKRTGASREQLRTIMDSTPTAALSAADQAALDRRQKLELWKAQKEAEKAAKGQVSVLPCLACACIHLLGARAAPCGKTTIGT
jgi:hypothetical protein